MIYLFITNPPPPHSNPSSWQVIPVNEFVERQGIKCYLHDLNTDDMMRRVQMRINKGIGENLGRGLGFFKNLADVAAEPDIAQKVKY